VLHVAYGTNLRERGRMSLQPGLGMGWGMNAHTQPAGIVTVCSQCSSIDAVKLLRRWPSCPTSTLKRSAHSTAALSCPPCREASRPHAGLFEVA
jgi:hypothetical protein